MADEPEIEIDDIQPQPITQPRHLFVQEVVRAGYAVLLLLILAGTVFGAFLGALSVENSPSWNNVKELLQLLLPAETALLGSAAGFYFGSRQ